MSENENGLESEKPEEVLKEKPIRRVSIDLDENDSLTRVIFSISKEELKQLKHEAVDRGCSVASILRELVKNRQTKGISVSPKKETKTEIKKTISDEDLGEVFNACQNFYGGFETTGEDGFFNRFASQEGWELNQLTDEQFCIVMNYLKTGYDGFMEKPKKTDFLFWIVELKPSEEQAELAILVLKHDLTISDIDETANIKELLSQIKEEYGEEETTQKKPSEKPSGKPLEEWQRVPTTKPEPKKEKKEKK